MLNDAPDLEEYIHLSFVTDMAKAIASATTINDTLQAVMTQIGTIFAPMNWSLLLRNSRTGDLTFKVVVGSGVQKILGTSIPKGQGIAGWIAETGQAIIIENVANDKRFDSSVDRLLGFKTESIIGVPLKTKDRVFGVIELINKVKGGNFTPVELKVLSTIADLAAIAIEKAYYLRALKRIALIDPLTGVHNRRSMIRFLEREVDRCNRLKTDLSVLMVDVDKFKEINDNYGHAAGDAVLQHLATTLQQHLRKIDIICRYGGDEFVAVMPDTSADAAEEVRRRVVDAVRNLETPAPLVYDVSVGLYSGRPTNPSEIFTSADFDMYREKNSKIETDIDNLSQNIGDFLEEEEGEGRARRAEDDPRGG